jgi:hypothetical protein
VQRYAAIGVGAVGVVALVVGTVFGLDASGKLRDSNADNHCDGSDACDPTGLSLRKDATSAATASTVAFVIGGVAVAGGVALWLTAPRATSAPAVGIAPRPGGAALLVSF